MLLSLLASILLQRLFISTIPFFAEAPLALALNTFLIGWEEQDRQYVVIALAPIG